MRFKPINEEDAAKQATGLWEDGIYDYEIVEAEEKVSDNGNEMTTLKVLIFDPKSGANKMIYENLVNTEKSQWRIREFAASCGLLDAYKTGSLMEGEMIGRAGICEVGTQPAKGAYRAKNVVRSWMQKADRSQAQPAPAAPARPASARAKVYGGGDLEDDIPFGACWQ